MPSLPADAAWAPAPSLRVDYRDGTVDQALADPGTLAAFGFGTGTAHADPRALTVPLQPLGETPVEVWRVPGPVTHGRDGVLRWSADGALLFGAVEIEEAAAGGIVMAAEQAYARLHACLGELATRERAALRGAFFDGNTYEELAGRMNVPLGTMKSWIRRAMIKLRSCLER